MHLDRLRMKNVRCFADTEVPLDSAVTVLVGENGAGKTTIAEAIASLSFGENEGLAEFPCRHGTRTGKIELFGAGKKRALATWSLTTKDERRQTLPDEDFVFAYGRYRRVYIPDDMDDTVQRIPSSAELLDEIAHEAYRGRTTTLDRPDGRLLRNLSRYLVAIYQARNIDSRVDSVWERLIKSLQEMGQGLEGIELREGEIEYIPVLIRSGVPIAFHHMSDGYQAILVIIFDLILRYVFLFNDLEEPLDGPATVVIDEVGLHLHVRWQRKVVRQLTRLFPKTQFILTTHSPSVVQGAIDDGHKIVTLSEKNGFVDAVALSSAVCNRLKGAEIGSVLMENHLFGAGSRYSRHYEKMEDELSKLRRKVEASTANQSDHQRLAKLTSDLEELLVKDEERRGEGAFMSELAKLKIAFIKDLAAEVADQ